MNERSFAFTVAGLTAIHRRIFDGVFKFAGQIRDYNITKKEWVLRGDTVLYVSAPDIRRAIEYDLEQEKAFDYIGLDVNQIVSHITKFVSGLWQIHPFGEGNTRTTAVFTIQYLRSMGFNVVFPKCFGQGKLSKHTKGHQKGVCLFGTILSQPIDGRKQRVEKSFHGD